MTLNCANTVPAPPGRLFQLASRQMTYLRAQEGAGRGRHQQRVWLRAGSCQEGGGGGAEEQLLAEETAQTGMLDMGILEGSVRQLSCEGLVHTHVTQQQ